MEIFNFGNQAVRTYIKKDQPLFIAKDVCDILEINNSRQALSRLDEDEKASVILNDGSQNRRYQAINEYGLYSLVLSSRKPEAKEFRRWVTHEVLPTIRQHGMYATKDTVDKLLNDPDTAIKLLETIKTERSEKEAAYKQLKEQEHQVVFARTVEVSKNSVAVKVLATILKQNDINIGQNRLFEWLRENKYLSSRNGKSWNMPTQKAMDLGLFELKANTYFHNNGVPETNYTPLVTGKGQVYFINKFKDQLGVKEKGMYAYESH